MKTAWILPGGASMGAVQVGQAAALIAAGHIPDLVVGTSAGALNAAWIAADPSETGIEMLRRLWLEVRRRDIFPINPATTLAGLTGRRDHLISAHGLSRWLEAHLPYRQLDEARIPITVTTTDLASGEAVLLSSGPAIPSLLASCAIPGLFPPVAHTGRLLVDGAVAAANPLDAVSSTGTERVFVLSTLGARPPGPAYRPAEVALRSVSLLLNNARKAALSPWSDRMDILHVPAPATEGLSPFSFRRGARLMDDARLLTESWLSDAGPRTHAPTDASLNT